MKEILKETAKDMRVWLGTGALAFAVGVLLVMASFTWKTGPQDVKKENITEQAIRFDAYWKAFYVGMALTALGTVVGGFGLTQRFRQPLQGDDSQHDGQLYSRHLVGLGYALLLVGLVNGTMLAGMTRTSLLHGPDKHVEEPSAPTNTVPKVAEEPKPPHQDPVAPIKRHPTHHPVVNAFLVLVAVGMSLLGALFFVANSLRRKREQGERFDVGRFWGGLWYRLGEAVLFTLVCFWLICTYRWESGYCWLPVLGLLLGMFVTSGERLVFGLGRRLFRAAEEFVPFTSSRGDSEARPGNAQMKKRDD